jgi:hypothetical protein
LKSKVISPVKYLESKAGGLVFLLVPLSQEKSPNAKGTVAGWVVAVSFTTLTCELSFPAPMMVSATGKAKAGFAINKKVVSARIFVENAKTKLKG